MAQSHNYQVFLIRGQVSYKGAALQKGENIFCGDLSIPGIKKNEMNNFSFFSQQDEVRLVNLSSKKIILVSARTQTEGRDLMLATRGMKFIKSDFEFQRAFNPAPAPLVLIAEDTIVCRGLHKYRFTENKILIARFVNNSSLIETCIGKNDSIFLTRRHLFSQMEGNDPQSKNTMENSEIRLLFYDTDNGADSLLSKEFKPFFLYFLDDLIRYYASIEYEDTGMSSRDIANALVPEYLKLRQIQREYGFAAEDEALQWLIDHIDQFTKSK